jgi:hypothetical protein
MKDNVNLSNGFLSDLSKKCSGEGGVLYWVMHKKPSIVAGYKLRDWWAV